MTNEVELVVGGRVGPSLAAALDGFTIDAIDGGRTRLVGPVVDQSMLLGVLELFGDLGIEVVSVNPVSRPDE